MTQALEEAWLTDVRGGDVREFFNQLGIDLPATQQTQVQVRCFANPAAHQREDRNPSCSINLITGLWCCHACNARGNAYAAAIATGHPEKQARELAQRYNLFLEVAPKDKPKLPGERDIRRWREQLHASPLILDRLAELKGWTVEAIHRCGLGWDGERITFPVRNPKLKLIGVVRYLPGGKPKMVALPGSTRGLFPAPEVLNPKWPLFIVEGEPAAVSVRASGHQATAIPGVASWRPDWAKRLAKFQRIVMLPDCDQQGRELARRVTTDTSAQAVDLEPGRDDGYDIGDMLTDALAGGGVRQITMLLGRLAAA